MDILELARYRMQMGTIETELRGLLRDMDSLKKRIRQAKADMAILRETFIKSLEDNKDNII